MLKSTHKSTHLKKNKNIVNFAMYKVCTYVRMVCAVDAFHIKIAIDTHRHVKCEYISMYMNMINPCFIGKCQILTFLKPKESILF